MILFQGSGLKAPKTLRIFCVSEKDVFCYINGTFGKLLGR